MKTIHKFTSADVMGNDDNSNLIDEGYFTETGFHSTITQDDCGCESKEEHENHLRDEVLVGN